ncbi:circadian clock KaiB family protein [Leptolyngbya sp. CCNP1308]|uniref:circadian clock KaiB family protein n=1 Tax=Leptolyngbya sp. CCNP1308 TaxID=3110255 RepID=UPI002B20FC17|nr:circadian clock KaiB family protein [Leptolyngbya sp. CCNP1308]
MMHDLPQDSINESHPEQAVSPEESDALTASFEQAIAHDDRQHYRLRLFVAGATPRSIQALERLKRLCETHLQGRYELEVIDVYQSPSALGVDNVVAIPTLVKQLPLPLRRIVGDLSDTEKVLRGLDLVPTE